MTSTISSRTTSARPAAGETRRFVECTTHAGGHTRLDHLSIPNYRNLRSFEIDFDESQPTTVLIGRNGSGKSNLIEAIVEIFRELELGSARLGYQLQYVCREHTIRLDADPVRPSRRLDITVDGKSLTQTAFQRDLDTYLPNYVFAYYSGWSSRLERHFDRPTRRHYDRILRSPDRHLPLRRLFFCRRSTASSCCWHSSPARPASARELLERYLGIKHFESALFVLKTPWWRGRGTQTRRSKLRATRASGTPAVYSRPSSTGFGAVPWRRSATRGRGARRATAG